MHKRKGIGKIRNRQRLSDKVEKETPPFPVIKNSVFNQVSAHPGFHK
jgi:hypothetical protein